MTCDPQKMFFTVLFLSVAAMYVLAVQISSEICAHCARPEFFSNDVLRRVMRLGYCAPFCFSLFILFPRVFHSKYAVRRLQLVSRSAVNVFVDSSCTATIPSSYTVLSSRSFVSVAVCRACLSVKFK